MAITILIKSNSSSGVAPKADELVYSELAINTADGHLYTKKTNDQVVNISSWDHIHNKPSLFPPSSHNHTVSEIQGIDNYVLSSDSRLSDSRNPLPHDHGNLNNDGSVLSSKIYVDAGNGDSTEFHKVIVSDNSGQLHSIDKISPLKIASAISFNQSVYDDLVSLSSDIVNHTHTSSNFNISIGLNALSAPTTGLRNVGVGFNSMQFSTSGNNNISIGPDALKINEASDNIAIGNSCLGSNIGGESNTIIGSVNSLNNMNGSFNVSVGAGSLFSNTTGIRNVAIGTFVCTNNTTGSNNTVLGHGARLDLGTLNGCLVLGSNAIAFASGEFALGSIQRPLNTSSTRGTNGSAQALTANPLGYLEVRLNGTLVKIPYYRE
jgi:hypothetical protein